MPDSCQINSLLSQRHHQGQSVPATATIIDLQTLSADTALFRIELERSHLPAKCTAAPGQFVQLSIPAGGEVPISIAGVPQENAYELCIRRVGHITAMAHRLEPGDKVGIRGPFGNGFPVTSWKGRNILLMAGGLGIAPLRSLLLYLLQHREDFGELTLMYGARDPSALLFREELHRLSCGNDFRLLVTVDFLAGDPLREPACRTGLLTDLLTSSDMDLSGNVAAVCGPPALYRCLVPELLQFGIGSDNIYLSLERHMKCGHGICCHCAVGDLFCCTDGPVFSYSQLRHIPEAL